jgi:hypothetical protein
LNRIELNGDGKDATMAQLTDHTRAEDLFSAYIDRHVTADEQVFIERHVAACAACRAQLHATRSLVTALNVLPAVKAPRSFVLPRSMAVQPKPSIFNWYPALRLATVVAAAAFVLAFAGDLLMVRPAGGGNMIMSAPAPLATNSLTSDQAPATAAVAKSAPAEQQLPSTQPAPAGAAQSNAFTLSDDFTEPAPTGAASAAGNAARLSPTATREAVTQAAPTDTLSAYAPTDTVETTVMAAPAPTVESTPAPAVEAPALIATTAAPSSIEPLRLASLVLGGLVVVLGVATLIARRGV